MKKGFTIVELLAVVTMLLVITLVVFPSIVGLKENNERKAKEEALNNIYMAAENYIVLNENECPSLDNVGGVCFIKINKLINNGFIDGSMNNPNTGISFVVNDVVKIIKNEDNTFSYELTTLDD